ncbi:MAG: hypothetical protein ACRDY2_00265 [Acidimicrobiales bacterium]
MSILPESSEPSGGVYDPDEARARPLSEPKDRALSDVSDDEWKAFQAALAEL